jgi:hypothetical protein
MPLGTALCRINHTAEAAYPAGPALLGVPRLLPSIHSFPVSALGPNSALVRAPKNPSPQKTQGPKHGIKTHRSTRVTAAMQHQNAEVMAVSSIYIWSRNLVAQSEASFVLTAHTKTIEGTGTDVQELLQFPPSWQGVCWNFVLWLRFKE